MPAYNSPTTPARYLQAGVPEYLFGSYNFKQSPTLMRVSQVALASNVATLTVQIYGGEVPKVGSLLTITQTTGGFNVTRQPITSVSIDNNGAGTVSYALTASNVGATPDFGSAVAEVPEVAETLVAGASVPVAVPWECSQRTLTTAVNFPSMPTGVKVDFQEAIRDVASEYTTLASSAVVASSAYTTGPVASFTLTRGNFYRFLVSGLSGTGTITAKVF